MTVTSPRRPRFTGWDTVVLPAIAVAVVITVWWAQTRLRDIPSFILPAPTEVFDAYRQHGMYLLREARATLTHTLAGFGTALAGGTAAALLLASSNVARKALLPLLVAMQAVPKVAIAPLLIVWFGFGASSKITLVALLCFFPVVVNTLHGLTTTPAESLELARSLTASRWRTMVSIRIPYALPSMFTGWKIAASLALIGAVVAEITSPNNGLGAIIMRSTQAANTALGFAAVGMLAAIGITLYYTIVAAQRWLVPWTAHTTG